MLEKAEFRLSVKRFVDRVLEDEDPNYSGYIEPKLSPGMIQQTNDPVRRAVAHVRVDRNPATMNQLYHALQRRQNARGMKQKPTDGSWIKHGL